MKRILLFLMVFVSLFTFTSCKDKTATPTPTPGPSDEPEQKGCGGSVLASIFGLLTLAGATIVLRKKREE